MNSTIIVTSADSKFFELVQGTILSIREKPQGYYLDIGFLDTGCTPEQLQWISQYVDHIVEPSWNYNVPNSSSQPSYLKALVSRPFLPKYFPGYEVYIWIDADAWLQDWFAIELLTLGARRKGFSIVPELVAKHVNRFWMQTWITWHYHKYFHHTEFNRLEIEPLLNAGVFSGARQSIHWSTWARRIEQAMSRHLDLWTDQFALNVSIYKDLGLDRVELLPLSCNWLAHYQLPLWDPQRKLWVDPFPPHDPIGVIHLTADVKTRLTHIVLTTEGFKVEASLRYPDKNSLPIKRYDYVSPYQRRIHLDYSFPLMTAVDPNCHPWPYLRKEVPHLWHTDLRQPTIGFVSRDEAHILYNTALKFQGKPALEIGCWLGWSTAHLAAGGVVLDVVDPALTNPQIYESVDQSLRSAGVRSNVNLYPGYSPEKVEEIAQENDRRWSLIYIDGNHDAPAPLRDAQVAERYAAEDALVLFHDLASPDVAEGLNYLRDRGWNTMIYQTMQIMGVAWRGNVQPVEHIPDPNMDWTLPEHLKEYPVCNLELSRVLEKVKAFTLLGFERLWNLYLLAKRVCQEDIPGNFVECGVYKGGSSTLLAWVIKNYSRRPRKVYAFDTFAGMPQPTEVDRDYRGVFANNTPYGAGALGAPISENLEVISKELGVWDLIVPVQGLFADTLPAYRDQVGEIALLHADADWYQSTVDIFHHLYSQVNSQGFIQIDDYGHWQGCRDAVHDFEQEIQAFFRLHSIDYSGVWVSLSENLPIVRDSSTVTLPQAGIRLSKFNVVLFPYWEMETEQLIQELEQLLQQILISPNPKDYALILLGDPSPQLANETLEIAAGNVTLKLMEEGREISEEPFCSLVSGLNAWQWERLIQHMNYRYPLKRERFPQGLRPAVQKLPVLLIAQ
ncbi:class I SAM-dependent methyltransferase [Synechococcus sp. RC10B2]|jgi:predicted O-methyltransferase YrrM|uniref:class I SAM-dependent methyltransferase n=1 Tax=unclassified Synechococcus TaxID=2626047 RepID=UPI0039C67B8A